MQKIRNQKLIQDKGVHTNIAGHIIAIVWAKNSESKDTKYQEHTLFNLSGIETVGGKIFRGL